MPTCSSCNWMQIIIAFLVQCRFGYLNELCSFCLLLCLCEYFVLKVRICFSLLTELIISLVNQQIYVVGSWRLCPQVDRTNIGYCLFGNHHTISIERFARSYRFEALYFAFFFHFERTSYMLEKWRTIVISLLRNENYTKNYRFQAQHPEDRLLVSFGSI